jgi:cell division protein FtsQ
MSAVAAPADRRFRRAHVKPARKHHTWRKRVTPFIRYGLVVVAVGYGVYRGSTVAAHATFLQIDHIVVRGNDRLSNGEVLALLGGLRGENLVRTDLDRWRAQLLASPWVRDAALHRSLPSTVEVVVWERQPAMVGRVNGQMYLLDERGTLIDQMGPQYADLDLPVVDGLATASSEGGPVADEARADLAARVISAVKVKPDIAERLSQINVTDLHNATVIVNGDPAIIELGDDQFLQRLQSYLDVSSTLQQRVRDIDSVDMRFDDRIYVRPTGKAGNPGAAAQMVPAKSERQARRKP